MAETEFDVIVVGTGPGGYVAAIRASQLGYKTAVVEREHLGGICLNWGCIPTKALLRSAEVFHLMEHADAFGLSAENISFDVAKVVNRSRKVAKQLSDGVGFLMKKNKITVLDGTARLEKADPAPAVIVSDPSGSETRYTAQHVILATGARARTIPQAGLEPDGKLIWTYKEAMVPDIHPKRLLVIGSGAIGIEFASFYKTLGSEVTVVEMLDRIVPVEDDEISAFAEKAFKAQGMSIRTSAQVKSLQKGADTVTATLVNKAGDTET
ncbi:MAG: FAD-dependent oxidoreductase, partial [Maricaulaceae bacterium]